MSGPPAAAAIPEPTRRLPPQARTLWCLQAGLRWLVAAVGVLIVVLSFGDELPEPIAILLGIGCAGGLAADLMASDLRWRRWRYEVREEEIDLLRGVLTTTRTLVPMARVQHADTHRGVLDRRFGVATVIVHTAAGATSIPVLLHAEASAIRDRIATLTRAPDEL